MGARKLGPEMESRDSGQEGFVGCGGGGGREMERWRDGDSLKRTDYKCASENTNFGPLLVGFRREAPGLARYQAEERLAPAARRLFIFSIPSSCHYKCSSRHRRRLLSFLHGSNHQRRERDTTREARRGLSSALWTAKLPAPCLDKASERRAPASFKLELPAPTRR